MNAWAIIEFDEIKVPTISESRRAAIINWLVVHHHLMVLNSMTDDEIDKMWELYKGHADAKQVSLKWEILIE